MPQEGIDYLPREDLMTYEELTRLVKILVGLGIDKVRLTGGEPFLRKDMMKFLRMLSGLKGLDQVHITTNGTLTSGLVSELKSIGIRSVNLSLDSLDRDRFFKITRRPVFDQVMQTFEQILKVGIPLKLNMVVMEQHNVQDIIPMAELTREYPIAVRYIEEMPFNGSEADRELKWNHGAILQTLQNRFPNLSELPMPYGTTATRYKIPGHQGELGIIAAYSRTFCGTCNRIRITPVGSLKTCLYDQGIFNIKDLMRNGASDQEITTCLQDAMNHRARDGFEAEARRLGSPIVESMSTIGG